MSELEFRLLKRAKGKCKQGGKQIYVTTEQHEKIRDISEKSGIPMYEVSEMLLEYSLEHVKWVEK